MDRQRSGYTLIEILVGLSIVAIVFVSGYLAFRQFAKRQILQSTIRSMTADFRLAQAEALAGKKPDEASCAAPNTLQGYAVEITSETAYEVKAICSGAFGEIVVKSVELPGNVVISTPAQNPILFKVLGQGTNLSAINEITVDAQGLTQVLTVSPGGTIE